jgi:hypothetical protein
MSRHLPEARQRARPLRYRVGADVEARLLAQEQHQGLQRGASAAGGTLQDRTLEDSAKQERNI